MRCLIVICLTLTVAAAEEQPVQEDGGDASVVLARVNGEAITLRQLEDELLRQEGMQTIDELLRLKLDQSDWSAFDDEDVIVKVADVEIPRILLVNQLLKKHSAEVRDQMINALVIRQAIAQAEITLDESLKQQMLKRMQRKYYHEQEQIRDVVVPYDSMIRERYGQSVEEWVKDPAFATLAGMYALLYQRTEIPEDQLEAYFQQHAHRYGTPEAYQLAVIPFHAADKEGKRVGQGLEGARRLASETARMIREQRRSFASIVRMMDPQFKGERGFVARDGRPENKGARPLPPAVMEAVFRHDYDRFPTVLGPVEAGNTISIVEVRAYRPGSQPSLDEVREAVRRDYIDADLQSHIKNLQQELREEHQIDYSGMMDVLQQRRADLRAYLLKQRETEQATGETDP